MTSSSRAPGTPTYKIATLNTLESPESRHERHVQIGPDRPIRHLKAPARGSPISEKLQCDPQESWRYHRDVFPTARTSQPKRGNFNFSLCLAPGLGDQPGGRTKAPHGMRVAVRVPGRRGRRRRRWVSRPESKRIDSRNLGCPARSRWRSVSDRPVYAAEPPRPGRSGS